MFSRKNDPESKCGSGERENILYILSFVGGKKAKGI